MFVCQMSIVFGIFFFYFSLIQQEVGPKETGLISEHMFGKSPACWSLSDLHVIMFKGISNSLLFELE